MLSSHLSSVKAITEPNNAASNTMLWSSPLHSLLAHRQVFKEPHSLSLTLHLKNDACILMCYATRP